MTGLTIACVRTGTRYGPEYVRILADMVARYLHTPYRFVCLTDKPDDLPDIECMTIDDLGGWWSKLELFRPGRFTGRVCYFDLDVAIVGPLAEIVEKDGIIRDWNLPMFNSSVMCWMAGERELVPFGAAATGAHKRFVERLAPAYPYGDQQAITKWFPDWPTFPPEWCVSYRASAVHTVPDKASVVVFHGLPKPSQITDGWVPEVWKVGGSLIPKFTRDGNVDTDILIENMRVNCKRPLSWFTRGPALVGKRAHIVCGGPGVENHLFSLKRAKAKGDAIIAVNGAIKWLATRAITPTWGVVMDARPSNARFVENGPKETWYLIASHCDPSIVDACKGRTTILWHADLADKRQEDVLKEANPQGLGELIGGHGTVGLRAILMAVLSGCENVHVYGMPSCLMDGKHHAYPQPENDEHAVVPFRIAGDKDETVYVCQGWMARQADEFQNLYFSLRRYWRENGIDGVLKVHGKGLVPALWKMNEQRWYDDMAKQIRKAG